MDKKIRQKIDRQADKDTYKDTKIGRELESERKIKIKKGNERLGEKWINTDKEKFTDRSISEQISGLINRQIEFRFYQQFKKHI